ncbi:MBL fold metallo-hydrolase [Cryobacterium cryoconiti]|uniref:MBL fold metallo-hydrolase n=1 Tax=Cryobacterium cryoconiti TaxID=1259239 RepID=A0A4Y8JVB7_9MICO|nr:MBL fold metallo-hydrolase [Cryobacterium cryoconiti]TFD28942.1 MBL fold metallo-hydrolase [Cryobacterium cryoconiti]
MKLTKLEHAALVLDKGGRRLFVDPGSFTSPLTDTARAAAIVITHEHPDHWTPEQLDRIISMNPDIPIFGPAGVAAAAPDYPVTVVAAGDTVVAEPFTLRFFGGTHAVIHETIPVIDNLGVLVDDELYYGGDSFALPEGVTVQTLAVPAGAPWLKISEVMDYVLALAPRRTFPTHEMGLSRGGKDLSNARIKWATEQNGGDFLPLEPNESLDL